MRIGGYHKIAILLAAASTLFGASTLTLSQDGLTVYDSANNITWLANGNLPGSNRFGIPACTGVVTKTCINPSGSMTYQAAASWVAAMNAANYLGHTNWQLPTNPLADNNCSFIGPQNDSFGWGCTASALGSLYYNGLGLASPNTAVPIPNITTGPFNNFQPYLYWSQTVVGDSGDGAFAFSTGYQGSNTIPNFLYVLPMIKGKIPGTPATTGTGLQVNPGGQTVYDPLSNVTWLANANIGATNTFGLPACKSQGNPSLCVNKDGAMNFNSAEQFVANMNAVAYLGQTNWQVPVVDPNCDVSYVCADPPSMTPFQSLYYNQLGLAPGTPVVPVPDIAVGPFNHIQPYLYWACQGNAIASPCSGLPAPGFQWSFSFGNGFEGTDVFANSLYVTAYFVGTRTSSAGPEIAEVANAESESPTIAPNTWVEIKGVNLAPDARNWDFSDFVGTQMPTQLDKVSVTVNGKSAYIYYISPTQINILTPPDALSGSVPVAVTNNGTTTAAPAQAQSISPSFFVFNGGPYIAATHLNGNLIGPATLYPGSTTPAKPGEIIVIYANGFGPTNVPLTTGLDTQSGTLSPLPVIQIGGVNATVSFAGLVAPGEFQFNVIVPASLTNGDQSVTTTYGGASTQSGALITIHN